MHDESGPISEPAFSWRFDLGEAVAVRPAAPPGPVEDYIPHRGAMRFLDRLVEADDEHAVGEADIAWNGPFVREGGVPAWFAIEYMAQTVAAWSGYRARREGRAPRIGLLLGSRHFEVRCSSFPVGSRLRIEVSSELAMGSGLGLFGCHVFLDYALVAKARLSVFEPDERDELLERVAT